MEIEEYRQIQSVSRRRVREVSAEIKRFLYYKIDWRDRLIAITGSRGTGKTTLILQHIKECFKEKPDAALYVSLDNLWFETHSLTELVEMHYNNGGTHIFIDEIHHMSDWQLKIKNIYDNFPSLNIVYTGSSLLRIDALSGDLSRRQVRYTLPGLSFREYLYFEKVIEIDTVSLPDLLSEHVEIANAISEKIRVLGYFNNYLEKGYYPFYKEVYAGYEDRLMQITNQILESDYPSIESINYSTIQKIKKMLYILAQSCPQTPNMSKLYTELETDRNQGLKMLYILDKANLLNILSDANASLKNMGRPKKIYCDNTNIMYSMTEKVERGTIRETFFLNQIKSAGHKATYPKQGDFEADEKYLFEVGGRTKKFDQIKDIPNSFLAIDDEEVGWNQHIPLWMFGLMY